MSQHLRNCVKLPMDMQPGLEADPLPEVDTLKIVTCPLCQAVYIPSSRPQGELPQQMTLLETAFLSLCHFCFRCQRPACPQCWNPVHHVCASCCEEAQLPFCSPVPSLEGLIFSSQPAQATAISFACLRNGRFYGRKESIGQTQHRAPTSGNRVTSAELPVLRLPHEPAASPEYPARSQPVWRSSQHGAVQMDRSVPVEPQRNSWPEQVPVEPRRNWPTKVPLVPLAPQNRWPAWSYLAQALPQIPSWSFGRGGDQDEYVQRPQEEESPLSLIEQIENILIVIIALLLFGIFAMIALSVSFASINSFFSHTLHVDIRSEIGYLLQWK